MDALRGPTRRARVRPKAQALLQFLNPGPGVEIWKSPPGRGPHEVAAERSVQVGYAGHFSQTKTRGQAVIAYHGGLDLHLNGRSGFD